MKIIDNIVNLFKSSPAITDEKGLTFTGGWFDSWVSDGYPTTDSQIGFKTSWAWTLADKIATDFSSGEMYLYEKTSDGKEKEVFNHPFLKLIKTNNVYNQSWNESLYIQAMNFLTTGNSFVVIERLNNKPGDLIPLNSNNIHLEYTDNRKILKHYLYQGEGYSDIIEPRDMIHVLYPSDNPYWGLSPLNNIKPLIDIDNLQTRYTKALLKSFGVLNGVLKTKKAISPENKNILINTFSKLLNPKSENPKLLILEDDADFQTQNQSKKEVDFLDTGNVNRDNMIGRMGVPKSRMLGESATYATAKVEERGYYRDTIIPLSKKFVGKYNDFIVNNYGSQYILKMEYPFELLDEEIDSLREDYKSGLISWEEYRKLRKWSEVPEKNHHFINQNTQETNNV